VKPVALAALALLVAGCASQTKKSSAPNPWYGATDRLDVVLAKINANNGRIATVNGAGRFDAWINDGKQERYVNGSAKLIHTKPNQLRMIAEKPSIPLPLQIFDLGANDEIYWFNVPEADTLWYGNVATAATNAKGLPISPTLIGDVLGVATLNTDLLAQPVPTMRFNPDYDAYMLTWSQPVEDRWVTLREVWYDRRTFEPRLIWLFDKNGRVVLRGKLGEFAPFDGADASAPRTARTFDLFFPETKSRLLLRLDDVRAERNGLPNRISYRFKPESAKPAKKINLDETTPTP
jgi:hypothetical protein